MFSFKTLFVAGLAAVASVSAAPCAERRHDQPEVDTAAVTSVIASTSTISTTISLTSTASAVVASATGTVPATGSEQPASVTDILNDVMAQIKPLTDTLNGMTKETATVEKVTEVTDELKSILNVAIKEVNAIVTSPLESILGLLDIGGLGQLIGTLLNVVFGALGLVLSVATNLEVIKPLLQAVGQLVGELISAILGLGALGGLVGSLLSTVLGLVGDVTNVISDLGLTELTGVLGL